MRKTHFITLAFFLCLTNVAQAAAYKCTDDSGKVSFSDRPCPASAAKDQKLFDRGAGSNPLNDEEKQAFKKGVTSRCTMPRTVCNCVAETMAEQLTYEEVMQTIKAKGAFGPSILGKRDRALAFCEKMAPTR